MTSTEILVCLVCLFLCKKVGMTSLSSSGRQQTHFISARVGQSITLQCFYDKNVIQIYMAWYKKTVGHKPQLIATVLTAKGEHTLYNEYENNPRFTLDDENGKFLLKVSDLHVSDSATYLCALGYYFIFEFKEAITVSVDMSQLNVQALVQQSSSEKIQPGGSVTLSCTVHAETCDGGHSVYWFKNSQEPHRGIIYAYGNNSDQCERKPDAHKHSCVYNLPLENLNVSDAGIYYCAVAACGRTVFGNGTKLDNDTALVLVYFLSSTLAFTTTVSILLAFLLCLTRKRSRCKCEESPARFSACPSVNSESCKSEENLHYSTVGVKKSKRPKRQRDETEEGCVYSGVKR